MLFRVSFVWLGMVLVVGGVVSVIEGWGTILDEASAGGGREATTYTP